MRTSTAIRLPVSWNTANMATNGSVGALLLHHHNAVGTRAEVVLLDTALQTDLSVVAGSTPSNPPLNSNVTITVTLTNVGTAATGVTVNAPLPADLTWVSDDSLGAYNPATGLWTVAAVPVGSQSLNIIATVTNTDPIPMLAQITANTPTDTNPANNQSFFVISAPRSGDLEATMVTSGATALVGTPISYTITLTNNGIDPAYSVNVADDFPAFPALTPTTATPSQGTFDVGTQTWNLGSLPNAGTATLVLGLNAPNMAGLLQNTATATSTTADPNAVNNTDTEGIQILSPADVSGTKNNAGQTYIGGTITYTVTLTNAAAYDQQDNPGAEFTDVLPSTMTLVSANATSGTAGMAGNTVTWDGVVPASGGTVTITVTATVNGTAVPGATITNTGTISYDADGNGTNEATRNASSNFVVTSPASITASMTVTGTFAPGSNVTYVVTIDNAGPAAQLDNPGDEFVDTLPSSLTLVSANASSGTATSSAMRGGVATLAGETVHWNGSIPAGGNVVITIVAQIDPSAPGGTSISNQGTVNYDADGNGTNESSLVTNDPNTGASGDATAFIVSSPATIVSPSKDVNPRAARIGQQVTYTIVINNTGTSAQSDNPGDEFIDVLSTELDLVSATATSGTAVATIPTRTVTWNGSIAIGGSVTITITAIVNASAEGDVSNQGTVNFDSDGNGTNESQAVTNDPDTAAAGDPTIFAVAPAIPALSPLAMMLLCAMLAAAALLAMRKMF